MKDVFHILTVKKPQKTKNQTNKQNVEIISSIFSDHSGMKLEINKKRKIKKDSQTCEN